MCGRYQVIYDGKPYWKFFDSRSKRWRIQPINPGDPEVEDPVLPLRPLPRPDWPPLREVKPTQAVPVFFLEEDGAVAWDMVNWWLCPPWGGDRRVFYRTKEGRKSFRWKPGRQPGTHFNSRWDTVTEPGTYWHRLLGSRRCLFPASGFIEWPDDEIRDMRLPKVPRLFTLKDQAPFFIAGIWDSVEDDEGRPFVSANLITVEPNDLLKALPHRRMPAILRTTGEVDAWLDAPDAEAAATLLRPVPAEAMEAGEWPPAGSERDNPSLFD